MKFLTILVLILITSSCRYQESFDRFKNLQESKQSLKAIENLSFTYENQKILRSYFLTVSDLINSFEEDSRYQNYFHKKFFTYYEDNICEEALIEKSTYQNFEAKCNVSGFYICPDEFRDFKKLLDKIFQKLTNLEKNELRKRANCSALLKDWGLE